MSKFYSPINKIKNCRKSYKRYNNNFKTYRKIIKHNNNKYIYYKSMKHNAKN